MTTTQYDALSRVAKLIPPDGTTTVNNVTTSYSGNCTTVTDQASKSRKSCSDGLGRLTQVFEDPAALNYETDYTYDTLNNLLTVNQKGGSASSADWRTRTFTYDSLSRLLTASNPESGTTTYTYDNNGNLQTKVAPAPNQTGSTTVTTTYSYDLLNRLTWKHYSDGTMIAGFGYDGKDEGGNPLSGVTNAIGRLTHSSNEVNGASTYSYDPMGRAVLKRGCVPLNCVDTAFPVVVTYDMAGDVTSYTNGAGVTLTQTIDTATRLTQITSSLNDAQHPVTLYSVDSSIGYYPQGALRKAYLGNGLTKTNAFNNALELCRVNLNSSSAALGTCADGIPSGNVLDLTAGFNAGIANNGNVASWNAVGQQAFNRTFIYDSLNRLGSMTDSASNQSCKGLSWTYDAWGNRTDQTVTLGSCLTFHTTVTTQNRLYDPVNNIYQYDAAGNLTYDGSHSYTYDDENRLSKVDGGSTATYVYDVEGRRIEKSVAGVRTDFVYDPSGKIVAETNGSGWQLGYVYAGGTLIAQYSGSATYFAQTDHLGSTRLLTGLGQTLASNGGFEQGQTGWTGWSGSVTLVTDPTRAHSGSNYVQISEPVNGGGSVGSASYAVQQGDQITFGGWAYLESGTAGYPGWFLAAEDANHNSINWIEAGPVPTTSSGWTFQSATYTVPAGVAFVHIYGDVYLPSSPMVLRVDDGFIDDDRTSLTIVQNLDYLPFGELNSSDSGITTHKFTGKERDSESGLDNFGARYHSSAMGRFVSPDPKHISAHLSDPQSFDRYAYARNNPFLYVDPDGKDFQKAAQDLKTFAKSMYIKVSIGIGYEAKVKVGAVEAKVGAAAKATAETSQDAILKVSRSAEAGASAGPTNGPKAGENISVEQTVLTINKDRTVTGAEKPNVTVTDTIGGNTSVNSSSEQIGLGLETPLGPEPIVGGAEVGTTREGLNALKDAASEVKDSLINPGPPSPPKPPAPPCSGGSYKCN